MQFVEEVFRKVGVEVADFVANRISDRRAVGVDVREGLFGRSGGEGGQFGFVADVVGRAFLGEPVGTDAGDEIVPYRDGTVFMAMVPPQNMQDIEFISINAGDFSLVYTPESFRDGYLRADRQYVLTFAIEQDSIEFIESSGNPEWGFEGEEEVGAVESGS